MAIARPGSDSDIYAIVTVGGFCCYHGARDQFFCKTATEFFYHLVEHKTKGDKVPFSALKRVQGMANGDVAQG